jgi:hypothetical protein
MNRAFVLPAVVALSLAAWCQTPTNSGGPKASAPQKPKVSPLAEYAGAWTSNFNGTIWLSLWLELRGDQLSGSLVYPRSFELNDSGELKSYSEERSTKTVTDAVVNPDGLLLSVKDADTQETSRFLMKILPPDKGTADLKMIGMSVRPGMSKPKPWRLVKSAIAKPPENQTTSPLSDYLGDWISTFDGKVWLLLELALRGGQIAGWYTHSRDLELNVEGGLKSVSDEKVKEKIADATLNADGLLLTIEDRGSQKPDQYLMEIAVPAKAAALTLLATDMPAGMPKPKSWVLLKFGAATTSKESTPTETPAGTQQSTKPFLN